MKYSAFISYNHRDARWATWLHRELERYRLPKRVRDRQTPVGQVSDRLPPVFRDRDELAASSDLAASVKQALAESATLIVICSPHSASSRWVNEEIRTFAALGRQHRIRCLIVDGEPHAVDPAREALAPALGEVLAGEPLAVDLRKGGDGRQGAKLKLIASILDVPFDELRQRELARRQRRLAVLASASAVGFFVMTALAVVAILSRNEAVQQRDLARQRTLTAERTVDFVKSMFEVSDPSEARGATVTAREILDRGVGLIDRQLADEPAVKAELGLTLGQVYTSLGLYQEGDQLIRRTFSLRHDQPEVRARQYLAFGRSQFQLGEYERAAAAFARSAAIARSAAEAGDELLPTILVGRGEAMTALGEHAEAEAAIRAALNLDVRRQGLWHSDTARDVEALALNFYGAGKFEQARPLFERALAIRRRVEGANSPSVSDNLLNLGNIAYRTGDMALAERLFRSRLRVDEQVLGKTHPDIALTLNSIARILVERRAFDAAGRLLERAVAQAVPQRGELHDDMAYLFSNLALARGGQGRFAEAEELMSKSVAAARANEHPGLAPNLTDLAALKCRRGAVAEGLGLLAEARPIMARDHAGVPWRKAWIEFVEGKCLQAGERDRSERLIRASAPPLRAKWPRGTYYREEIEPSLARLTRG